MQIQKSGRVNDVFAEELKKKLAAKTDEQKVPETKLEGDREDKGQKPPETTTESALDGKTSDRKDTEKERKPGITEVHLEDKKVEGNAKLQGLTEKRLDQASTKPYPHRNEEAWARTGEKRPVNNLPEESGEASDEERIARYDKFDKRAQDDKKRLLDKDVGKQKTLVDKKSFNLHEAKTAAKYAAYAGYLSYKGGVPVYSGRVAQVRKIDSELATLMSAGRQATPDEAKKIDALKAEKSRLLGVTKGS
jgi:hypothetical protein